LPHRQQRIELVRVAVVKSVREARGGQIAALASRVNL